MITYNLSGQSVLLYSNYTKVADIQGAVSARRQIGRSSFPAFLRRHCFTADRLLPGQICRPDPAYLALVKDVTPVEITRSGRHNARSLGIDEGSNLTLLVGFVIKRYGRLIVRVLELQ